MGVADDTVAILQAAGVGVYGDTIFVGSKASLPDGDAAFITLQVTGGLGPEGTHNSTAGPAYVRPSVQVVARATRYADAEALAARAFAAIYPVRNQFVNGTWWREVSMTQSEPFDIGEDDNARPRLAFNFMCVKRPSPATS